MRSSVTGLLVMAVLPWVAGGCASAPSVPPSESGAGATPVRTATATATATPPPATISPSPTAAPAATADGQIVFEDAGRDFQFSQVWIENADGSNVRRLVSSEATDSGPVLSPDGSLVVFYRSSGERFGRIMLVDVDGSGLRELVTGSSERGCDAGVEADGWSPDGGRLAFTRTCFDRDGSYVGQGLWTIELDGAKPKEITRNAPSRPCPPPYECVHLEDHRAAWSPDGKQLAFQRIDTSVAPERSAIFTIGLDGKRLRQVTAWTLDANDPDWSPDGSPIAFNSPAEPARRQNIYTIRPDGTALRQLTHNDEEGQQTFHPSWSPDGKRLLFSHDGDLYVMHADGSDLHVVAATPLLENHASWGPSPAP